MPTDLQTIESYWSVEEAELAKGFLAFEGIRCQLDGRAIAGNFWHLNIATGGVKLRTSQQDAERATALLEGIAHQDELSQEDTEEFWHDHDEVDEAETDANLISSSDNGQVEGDADKASGEEYRGVLQLLRQQKWLYIVVLAAPNADPLATLALVGVLIAAGCMGVGLGQDIRLSSATEQKVTADDISPTTIHNEQRPHRTTISWPLIFTIGMILAFIIAAFVAPVK